MRSETMAYRGAQGVVAYLHVSWCTHGNDVPVVHICAESVVKYDTKVNISGNDTSRWVSTSFTAYAVKRRKSALCQW